MLLLLCLLLKYRAFLLSELRESRLRSASWRSAGHVWTKLIVELCICGLCCPIGISWTWYVNPSYVINGGDLPNGVPESIDGIIACAMMLRLCVMCGGAGRARGKPQLRPGARAHARAHDSRRRCRRRRFPTRAGTSLSRCCPS